MTVFSAFARDEKDRHLGDGIALKMDASSSSPLGLKTTYGDWKTRGDVERIQILIHNGDSTGLELRRYSRMDRKPTELVHLSTEGEPVLLAIIEQSFQSDPHRRTTIYSPQPRYKGQIPTTTAGKTFYPWAAIVEEPNKGCYFQYSNTLQMMEKEGDRSMKRKDGTVSDNNQSTGYSTKEQPGPSGPETVLYKGARPAAAIRDCSHAFDSGTTVDMTVAHGIDPCLVVCVAADRMNRQCKYNTDAKNQAFFVSIFGCCC